MIQNIYFYRYAGGVCDVINKIEKFRIEIMIGILC
jgi:hypothetical protein